MIIYFYIRKPNQTIVLKTAIQTIKSILFRISDLTIEKKALSITAGFYLGLFPLTGLTTILCQLAVFRFKLSTVLVQSINLSLSPLQILLMFPMMKTGRILFYNDHHVIHEISSWFNENISGSEIIFYIIQTVFSGVIIWGIITLSTGYFFYRILCRTSFHHYKAYRKWKGWNWSWCFTSKGIRLDWWVFRPVIPIPRTKTRSTISE